jgi:hypothetical protein
MRGCDVCSSIAVAMAVSTFTRRVEHCTVSLLLFFFFFLFSNASTAGSRNCRTLERLPLCPLRRRSHGHLVAAATVTTSCVVWPPLAALPHPFALHGHCRLCVAAMCHDAGVST